MLSDSSDSYIYGLSDDSQEPSQTPPLDDSAKLRDMEIERRRILFDDYFEMNRENEDGIFKRKGFEFITYSSKHISFHVFPSMLARYVSSKLIFKVILRHRQNYWYLRRCCQLPLDLNTSFNRWLCPQTIGDDDINEVIKIIQRECFKWANKMSTLHLQRFQRYRDGDEDVVLNSDEEELFLNDEEIRQLRKKRVATFQRMLPPTERTLRPRRKSKRRQEEEEQENDN